MDIFDVLSMLGGLALLLYGMEVMGNSLEKLSGGRLEKLLEKMTSTRFKAVLLGAAVTAAIQSSSATTVMVVGFVNSGIMKLGQAVGIIMGANIGTTITSWILSLAGLDGSNFFMTMLKPTSFSPILAVVGIVLVMFCKNEKKKDLGSIFLGFAILMFGMNAMSSAVSGLAEIEGFQNLLTMFKNPVLGMLAGLVLTAIIQSSAASIGILQAFCVSGIVTYGAVIPIVLGQNIGTCVTAILSSIGAKKNAKRTAAVHLYFNIIGTAVFMIAFYALNAVFDFAFLDETASAGNVALIHSLFNVGATIVLFPFAGFLEKLAVWTIRDKKDEVVKTDEFQVLDARFLDTPAFAMEQCKNVTSNMAELARKALFDGIDLLGNYDEAKAKELEELESLVDRYEDELGAYLIKISSRNLSKKDSSTVSKILHCIGDFERISDHAVNLGDAAREMHEKNLKFSPAAAEELSVFTRAVKDIVNTTVEVFESEDVAKAKTVEPLEEVIDGLNRKVKNRHVQRLQSGECTIELGFVLSDISTNYERVSDHCSNIAVCIIQMQDDAVEAHEYLDTLKREENEEFRHDYQEMKKKYRLPEQ
ncbi:MAG: Na/Pi cotransporter family protein [Lachnospiraceae bacterium]